MKNKGRIEKSLLFCSLGGFAVFISVIYYFFMSITKDLSTSSELVLWAEKNHTALSLISEAAIFSAVFLLISSNLLLPNVKCRLVKSISKSFIIILAMALVLTSLFSGRLVYQVYHIVLNDAVVKLVISSMVAAVHMASLALSVFIVTVSFSLSKKSKLILVMGIVAALSQFVLAYPWLLPFGSIFIIIPVFLIWFMLFLRFIHRC
ncbi:hypothetical protein ACVR0O_09650 [Streptococcus caviae]|uniref:hypothetical protein n=1 Tax=Streptococcus sp. 'caviae' TaxID=1915004 RepID=UPI00094BA243|nr:hypothetical protein [Streptococcus sp. 'caviae']OLN82331.1 hypothetical protein BMI76_09565 [Streptococcus sp. 'caviae']